MASSQVIKIGLITWLVVIATNGLVDCGKIDPAAEERSHNEGTKVERKITIFVTEDETTTVSASSRSLDQDSIDRGRDCKRKSKREQTQFKIDETTKLIYIDKDTESGLLVGEIISKSESSSAANLNETTSNAGQAKIRSEKGSPASVRATKDVSGSTNYTVFLVSRNPDHIAVLIDVDEIDFESNKNCENQEIGFSIIGEIRRKFLFEVEKGDQEEVSIANDTATNYLDEQEESVDEESAPFTPMPVAEAMALVMNSPLNKTIMAESDEMNDFKVAASMIDYLHEKTCLDVLATLDRSKSMSDRQGSPDASGKSTRKCQQTSRRERRKSRRGSHDSRRPKIYHEHNNHERKRKCPLDSEKFRDLMSERLQENFEWDEFKSICGKTKQIIIPMRSFRLYVFSDEFSPSSSFKLRYKFISDPTLLPALDNGKYFCRNRNIIDISLKCNGIDDCGDASDESIKICGYPKSRSGEPLASLAPTSARASPAAHLNSSASGNKKKLTYVTSDILHCCQSSDWLDLMTNSENNRLNLQSLIDESMDLFSGPNFAPITGKRGKRRVKRIVGGGVAQKGMWPGQASLQYETVEPLCHFCAGTLIHPQYVLTAGHCITRDGLVRGIRVVFGAHDLRQVSGNHIQVRYVDDAHIYPGVDVKQLNFDWENDMNNDIALLRLNAPVLVTSQVAPACLPPFNRPLPVNTNCRSIGWGQTHGSGNSNLLKHLSMKVVNASNCSKELMDRENSDPRNSTAGDGTSGKRRRSSGFAKSSADLDSTEFSQEFSDLTMLCLKNDRGSGICQGDSGGPLYCDRLDSKGETCSEIYGVASFIIKYSTVGATCAVDNLPEIFGEVSTKTEWISSTIKMFEQAYKLKYP